MQLYDEFAGSFKKLFSEASKKKGDPISKKIVDGLDEWLKSELERAIDDQEREMPRF